MNDSASRVEGDINLSPSRKEWLDSIRHEQTLQYLEEDARYFFHQSMSTPCLDVLGSCEGIYLTDIRGKRYMDFHGNNVHQLGYRNPYVVEKIKAQLDVLPFSPRRFTNLPAIELAQTLGRLFPGNLNRVLFAPGGTSGVERIPPPTSYRGPFSADGNDLIYAEYLEYVIEKEGDIGAFIAETIRNTDVQVPSAAYWKRVREICSSHGVLLILDEIPIAFGRTGKMFCFEHYGIEPDMVCLGKGLGGGIVPMAALVARNEYNIASDVSLGHFTHEKSPLGCVAGKAVIDYIEQNKILDKVTDDERFMRNELMAMKDRHPLIGDVRGIGLLWGIELVKDRITKEKATEVAEKVMYKCLENGLSFKVSQGNVIQLSPPLVITRSQLQEALAIVESAIGAVQV